MPVGPSGGAEQRRVELSSFRDFVVQLRFSVPESVLDLLKLAKAVLRLCLE